MKFYLRRSRPGGPLAEALMWKGGRLLPSYVRTIFETEDKVLSNDLSLLLFNNTKSTIKEVDIDVMKVKSRFVLSFILTYAKSIHLFIHRSFIQLEQKLVLGENVFLNIYI
jgi:hypothetical protein